MNTEIQTTDEALTSRDRWLAAVCYLAILVIIPLLQKDRRPFVTRHVRQGFALFFTEIMVFLVLITIEGTIGRIPVLGALISIFLYLVVNLGFLGLSVFGFVRAAGGEEFSIPLLDDLAEKLPIH